MKMKNHQLYNSQPNVAVWGSATIGSDYRTHLKWVQIALILIGILTISIGRLHAQAFGQSNLNFNGNGGVNQATSLMYGPDGRLYVLSLNGTVDIFTVVKNGSNDYVVTASEELLNVKNIPNHNDDGSSNSGNNREATGLTVAGTAANPVIYVTSSDSRVGGPGGDLNLDTNSGVITRFSWNGSAWVVVDIVRGLPRSEENHATNGLEFVTVSGTDFLIVSQGGHANAGAPSDNFAWTTEYALSAAILSINLTMLEGMTIKPDGSRQYIYDIPTLDDPSRPNVGPTDPDEVGYTGMDQGDPWGGNDGLNQAMLVPGGPVQIFSPGYRNSYDLTITQSGAVYITDNGANGGWGGLPENEGTANVTNNYDSSEPGSNSPTADGEQVNNADHLTMATENIQAYTFGSFYGGHPAPIRANPAGAGLYTNPSANSTTDAVFRTLIYDPDGSRGAGYTTIAAIALPANWPPVPVAMADVAQADWRGPGINNPDGPNDVIVTTWSNNTNGIDEYTSTIFSGSESMVGDLIAGKNGGVLKRVQLNANGSLLNLNESFASNLGGNALGITCSSDTDPFPGTIWVATFNSTIKVLEPQPTIVCIPFRDPGFVDDDDTDLDGYTNLDEVQNGTDHCNGGSQPNDFDKSAGGTLVSDLNDPDDDNDGILDENDPFQLGDPTDAGSDAFNLPVLNDLLSDNPQLQGYLGLGFTGLMNNGEANPNWLNWLDVAGGGPNPNDILGGAVGAMTMQMTEGTALNGNNSQDKAFLYGVNVDQTSGGFTVTGRLFNFTDGLQLYGASAPVNGELGLFIGDGTQSNYIKFVINQNGLQTLQEIGDSAQTPIDLVITNGNRPANDIIMHFIVNPATGVVTLQYQLDSGAIQTLGSITAQGAILNAIQNSNTPLAVGLIGSSNTADVEVEGTWDYLYVQGSNPSIQQTIPDISELIGASPTSFDLDSYFSDDGGDANLTYSVVVNTDPAIGASVTGSTLDITFPGVAATSDITVRATDTGSLFIEQTFTVTVADEPVPILRIRANGATLTATDAPNPDWVGITATGAQSGTFNGIGYSVNTGNHSTHNIPNRDAGVPSYVPQAIFANERWDPGTAPEMQWTINLPNGNYVVRLYMGNGFAGTSAIGQRVFDISIEGQLVQNDLDLASAFGHQVGGMLEYPVTLTDTALNILFGHVTENPLVNGIEILQIGGGINVPIAVDPVANQTNNLGDSPSFNVTASGGDPNENFSFVASNFPPGLSIEPTNGAILGTISTNPNDAGLYNASVTVSKPSSSAVVENFTWNVIDPSAPNSVIYRVNTGGALTSSTDASPVDWEEDQSAANANGTASAGTPSQYVNTSAEDVTFGAALPSGFVNNTGYPNSLFSTERYNTLPVPDNMQWDFPLANGSYTVNLIFAEIWTGAQANGTRIFDVLIEGQLELDDLDQTATYGWGTAAVESFTVNVTDSNLDIDFIMGVQNPNIKAIEIISSAPPVNDSWTNITNVTEHTPRHENSVVQVGNRFYLFGGRENSDKIDVYNYQTDTWTEAASTAPFQFNHFQATEYQGLIWVIGAFKANDGPNAGLDEPPADNIFMYDPITDTWIQGPAIPAGRKRGSAGLVLHNNKFYVIAGNTIGHSGGYIPWFDEFDPATGTWTQLTDAPRARDHFHASVIGNKLYAVGGRLSGGPGGTFAPLIPEVDVYDFANPGWSTLPTGSNLPTPRAASATVNFQGKLVVIGGEGNGQAYVNTDALDVSTGTWTALDDLNNARHGTQAIVSGDGIWITSGSPNQGGGNQNNMEVYGTDNPTGTALVAGSLNAPATFTVPAADTETIVLSNTGGNQGIFITNVSFSGANANNFSIVGGTSFLVPSGGSSSIVVAHTGTAEGEVASLDISYGSASTTSVSLTSGQAASTVLYRVNTGGPLTAAADAPNPDWSVDEGTFGAAQNSPYLTAATTPGGIYSQTAGSAYQGPIDVSHPSVPPGTPSSLFQTERFDAGAAPEMTWAFPVDPGTDVEVRLYFAELFNGITAAGQRVFDVSVEGTVPASFNDIDPFGTAGALGAIMVSHTVTVTDGTLNLEFIHGVENPALKAIEIVDVSGGALNSAPIVTNPGTQQSVDGEVINVQVVASDTEPCTGLTYSATDLPPSLSIDPLTGLITGTLDAGTGSGTPGAFIESNGLVIMEAETDFVETPSGWNLTPGTPTFLTASTDHFGNTNGQTLTYDVEITTPGVYRFHVKSAITGSSSTEENDTWFKIDNTPDVHFFCVDGGTLTGTQQFLNVLGGSDNSRTLFYPAGNAQGRPNFSGSNPGNSGFFKVYKNSIANSWSTQTIDNAPKPIYAYFPNAGTFSVSMSERSAGHKIDRIALAHLEQVSTGVPTGTLNGAESQQSVGGSPGASDNSPYNVTVTVADGCTPPLSTEINFVWNVTATPIGNPAANVQVTAGGGLGASTFGDNSFLITNTGDDNIVNVTINSSTGFLRDVVFDPVGTAGDNTAKCLTEGSNSIGDVGITVPANGGSGTDPDCVSVFTQLHNGADNAEGYDVLTMDFSDFNPGEAFAFGVDMDPTSIKEDQTSGDAGSISGFELIGTTVSIEFASGVIYTVSLFDEGSLGGSDAVVDVTGNALVAPSIAVDGSALSRIVPVANQVVQVTGQPNSSVTLLRVDGRLHIDAGNPGAGYDIDPFEANEAMAKELYTIQLDGAGLGTIPVVLTQTPGTSGAPAGGLNHFIAVTNGPGGENSIASNVIVLEFDPNVVLAPSALVEITPGTALGASTFGGSSFQITNTSAGGAQITNITIDLSTAILPDMVFDPTGAGGDATANCFTPNSGATAVGLIAPTDPCADPFSQPRNGGFDILSVDFNGFDPSEFFAFTTDVDPNSIQGVAGAGNAGAVSGYELTGATVTVTFSDGSTLTGSLYEDGSLGGSQAVVAENAPVAPAISVVGVGTGPATVNSLNQTVTVTGTPGDNVSLLVMDSRLFIASGDPPFNVPDPTYYANEAMSGKTLFTGEIGGGGTIDIPITLLQTPSGNATPDGGLNQLIAVSSSVPYAVDQQVSQTSNVITLLYAPNAVSSDLTLNYTLQGRTDHTIDLRVDLYEVGSSTPLLQLTPTGAAAGEATVTGIPPGTYELAVKSANHLQRVQTVTLVAGANSEVIPELNAGDANDDNFVTLEDFTILSQTFNLQTGDTGFDPRADFNGDGFVALDDFSLLSINFNTAGENIP